jgi:coenzyme F420 hydrogenase subunit beta
MQRPALGAKSGRDDRDFLRGRTDEPGGGCELIEALGVDEPGDLESLRFRGHGWPGEATAVRRTESGFAAQSMPYAEGVGRDSDERQAVALPRVRGSYGGMGGRLGGRSVASDDRGGRVGSVVDRDPHGARPAAGGAGGRRRDCWCWGLKDATMLPRSQPNLLKSRGDVWGRVLASRLIGLPAPRYRGLPMLWFWMSELSAVEKVKSLIGTVRRALTRKLHQSRDLTPLRISRADARRDDEEATGALDHAPRRRAA